MKLKVVLFSLARTTFYMPDAEANYLKSCDLLRTVFDDFHCPEALLTSPEMLAEYADTITQPDLMIYQCSTFIGADFMAELALRFTCPAVIWSVKEPSIDGGRLRLNSLTGAFSAGNYLYSQDRNIRFVFGNPEDGAVRSRFQLIARALMLAKQLRSLTVGMIGSQPAGFAFGAIDQALLLKTFGVKVVEAEASEIMREASRLSSEEYAGMLDELRERTRGWENMPEANLDKYARLRKAFQNFTDKNKVGAIASRCWPDFFTGFGAPVCSVLSMLNDNGIPSSCETDMGGAVSMYMASQLTNSPVYFGDPVAVEETSDGIVFWHCGAGATCLSRKKEGAQLGVHPNRKIGPTMEFGLREGDVTVLRLGKGANGFRMFVMKGKALDEPQKFYGTSVVVRPEGGGAVGRVSRMVEDGWEPHFVIAYGNIAEELKLFCNDLHIPIHEY